MCMNLHNKQQMGKLVVKVQFTINRVSACKLLSITLELATIIKEVIRLDGIIGNWFV